ADVERIEAQVLRFARREENATFAATCRTLQTVSRAGNTLPGTRPMPKSATLISLAVATVFVSYSAVQFSGVSTALTQKQAASPPVTRPNTAAKPDAPQPVAARPDELVYKSVVRCLGDMDDLLDAVHDAASFAAVKPKLLDRARQQAALA